MPHCLVRCFMIINILVLKGFVHSLSGNSLLGTALKSSFWEHALYNVPLYYSYYFTCQCYLLHFSCAQSSVLIEYVKNVMVNIGCKQQCLQCWNIRFDFTMILREKNDLQSEISQNILQLCMLYPTRVKPHLYLMLLLEGYYMKKPELK